MAHRSKADLDRVALFIDGDNLTGLDEEALVAMASEWGQVAIARWYGKFGRNRRSGKKVVAGLSNAGIDPVNCTGTNNGHGDVTDLVMIHQILHTLVFRPDIKYFVVCTGDGGFLPIILAIRALNRKAIVFGPRNATSAKLMDPDNVDDFQCAPHPGNSRRRPEAARSLNFTERPSGNGSKQGLQELRSRATSVPPLQKPRPSGKSGEERLAAVAFGDAHTCTLDGK